MILRHLCLWERYIAPPRPQWPRPKSNIWNIVILNDYGLTEIQSTIWPQLHWEPQPTTNFCTKNWCRYDRSSGFCGVSSSRILTGSPSAVWCQTRVGWENSPFSSFRVSVKFVNISKTVRPKLLLITNRKSHVSFRLTPWHGRRAFSVAVSATWNCLSDELREPLSYCEQFQTVTLYSFVCWVLVHTAH